MPLKTDSLKPSSRSQNHCVSSSQTAVRLRIAAIASNACTSVAIRKRATIEPYPPFFCMRAGEHGRSSKSRRIVKAFSCLKYS